MKEPRLIQDYLADILRSAVEVSGFVKGYSYESFCADKKTTYAVIRGIEVIGEAVRCIPADTRKKYPRIPWSVMAGMRDRLIHDYMGVNLMVVWKTATEDLPAIEPELRKILHEFGG